MKHLMRLIFAGLIVLLPLALVTAQDSTPANGETPAPLPAVPSAPYVKEHVEALQANLEHNRSARPAALALVEDKQTAADEADLSDEEAQRRATELAEAKAALAAIEARIESLQNAITAAERGPTRAQLQARQAYDRRAALIEQVRRDLILSAENVEGQPDVVEGERARALRLAEEEQVRVDHLAAASAEFEFQRSRVYDKMSDIEKLEYEMRWATERFRLAIAAYDHLTDVVFEAYRQYEFRAFEGLKAGEEALALYEEFKGSPAESLELPEAARPVAELAGSAAAIQRLYDARVTTTQRATSRYRLRSFEGKLEGIQRDIDIREDYLEKLGQDVERLKSLLSASTGAAPGGDEAEATPLSEDYQKLSNKIARLKDDLRDNALEIERLGLEREDLLKLVQAKLENERVVEAIALATEQHIRFIEQQFVTQPVENPVQPPAGVEVPTYFRRPSVVLFTLRERLKAENERLSTAKRDTRQEQTRLEILERRIESLIETNAAIEEIILPETRKQFYKEIAVTVGVRALKVAGVLVLAWLMLFLIKRVGGPLIERVVRRADKNDEFSADEQQRARTLMTVFMTTARVVVYITAIMFAIAQFDVDYGPLLVAAGGVSLAVGFGAQTLVKDFFAGFFILLEGQFSIGDVVEVNGKVGTVENLSLRTTVVRGLNGDVHTIPNGMISTTTNMTKLWSRTIVDIGVAYEENTDDVSGVLDSVAREMRDDENWARKVLDHVVMGVVSMADSSVIIRVLLKTRAGEQWGASREYQRRVKLKFDELGIEIPWPQRVVSHKSYKDKDRPTIDQESRRKRAQVLRYVRRTRGEITEDEAALANLSVEERDRAETMARRESELATEQATVSGQSAQDVAVERKLEAKKDTTMTDAEVLARKLAARDIDANLQAAETAESQDEKDEALKDAEHERKDDEEERKKDE